MIGFFFYRFFLSLSLVTVPPTIDNLERGEDEIEKESVISKGSSEKTLTSSTVMSRRTKDSARGSIVGEIDEGKSQCNCRFWSGWERTYSSL